MSDFMKNQITPMPMEKALPSGPGSGPGFTGGPAENPGFGVRAPVGAGSGFGFGGQPTVATPIGGLGGFGQAQQQLGTAPGGAGQGGPGGWHPGPSPVGMAPNTAAWDAARTGQAQSLQMGAEQRQQQDSANMMKQAYDTGSGFGYGR